MGSDLNLYHKGLGETSGTQAIIRSRKYLQFVHYFLPLGLCLDPWGIAEVEEKSFWVLQDVVHRKKDSVSFHRVLDVTLRAYMDRIHYLTNLR